MNIFATSKCPKKCAQNLDNKRMIKMVLETAQLLSTTLRYYGISKGYKSTHINHPCSIWARSSRGNYIWLLNHFKALCHKYTIRYGKIHKSQSLLPLFEQNVHVVPRGRRTKFVNCARRKDLGLDFTSIPDVQLAYQLYLAKRWELENNYEIK